MTNSAPKELVSTLTKLPDPDKYDEADAALVAAVTALGDCANESLQKRVSALRDDIVASKAQLEAAAAELAQKQNTEG